MKVRPGKTAIRRITVILLLLGILAVRMIPHAGELYARHVYPTLSGIVSWIASILPYSLTEWIVVAAVLTLIVYPILAHRRKVRPGHILAIEAEIVCWMFTWFYLGWAMNYYRDSIYQRASIKPRQADTTEFRSFLHAYIDSLNASYIRLDSIDREAIQTRIKELYAGLPAEYGLSQPRTYQHPKKLVFNGLYSAVGVLGYMGPFADESHLNELLPPVQYAYTYAHELSHLLSVSNEAEANFWAYEVCTHAGDKAIRYSGYYGILVNVLNNAYTLLDEDEYQSTLKRIDPRILRQVSRVQRFWKRQHIALLDELQDALFNALLRSNRIPSGMKNYNQVVEIIISYEMNNK